MRPARRKPSRRRGSAATAGDRAARAKTLSTRTSAGRGLRHAAQTVRSLRTIRTMDELRRDQLRRGREAVSDIAGQLDRLLAQLREPAPRIDARAPEQLAGAARQADAAFSALAQLRRLLP